MPEDSSGCGGSDHEDQWHSGPPWCGWMRNSLVASPTRFFHKHGKKNKDWPEGRRGRICREVAWNVFGTPLEVLPWWMVLPCFTVNLAKVDYFDHRK